MDHDWFPERTCRPPALLLHVIADCSWYPGSSLSVVSSGSQRRAITLLVMTADHNLVLALPAVIAIARAISHHTGVAATVRTTPGPLALGVVTAVSSAAVGPTAGALSAGVATIGLATVLPLQTKATQSRTNSQIVRVPLAASMVITSRTASMAGNPARKGTRE